MQPVGSREMFYESHLEIITFLCLSILIRILAQKMIIWTSKLQALDIIRYFYDFIKGSQKNQTPTKSCREYKFTKCQSQWYIFRSLFWSKVLLELVQETFGPDLFRVDFFSCRKIAGKCRKNPLLYASGEIEHRREDENFGNHRPERLSDCADPVARHFLPFQVSTPGAQHVENDTNRLQIFQIVNSVAHQPKFIFALWFVSP